MEKQQRLDDLPTDEEAKNVDLTEILDQKTTFEFSQDAACLLVLTAMFFVPPIITSLGVRFIDDELLKSDSLVRNGKLQTCAAISVFFSVISSIWLSTNLSARLKFICVHDKSNRKGTYWLFISIVFIGMFTFGLKDPFDFGFEFKSKELKNDDFLRSIIIGSSIVWGIMTGFALKAPWDSMRDEVYDSLVKKRARQGFLPRNEDSND